MENVSSAALERFLNISAQNQELEATVSYLTGYLSKIVKSSESPLICFPREKETDFGRLAERAVRGCGGFPVFWERDCSWKELVRLAFLTKASTIIATPMVLLGLSKIARYEKIRLFISNAVLAGYPCLDWIMDGIERNLDCKLWGIFAPRLTSVVAGASCPFGRGLHLREDKYAAEIVGEKGEALPPGAHGIVVLHDKNEPEAFMATQTGADVKQKPCPCGNPAPYLENINEPLYRKSALMQKGEELLSWSSILDCAFRKTPHGLELDVVCFPGEKLPVFPDCAKLMVRPWDPEKDRPMVPSGCGIV